MADQSSTQTLPAGSPAGFQKPAQVQTLAVITLISGILNILTAFGWTSIALLFIIPTIGLSLLCLPVTILPGVLGVFELIYAANLMANPPRPVQPNRALAILEILCILTGNPFAVIVGILALVFYADPATQAYFTQLNNAIPGSSSR